MIRFIAPSRGAPAAERRGARLAGRARRLACAALLAVAPPLHAAPGEREVVRHYAALVYASYEDTLAAAKSLEARVDEFVRGPTAAGLEETRAQWRAAREIYGRTEAFRFYGGPIDDARGPEPRINAWPVDESHIDSVRDQPSAGIVNQPAVPITRQSLIMLNQRDGEENVATGWHAIEFLLWGQDQSDDGPGARTFEEFVDGRAPHADRRRAYLRVAAGLLTEDLAYVTRAWQPDTRNYRSRFVAGPRESLRRILLGLGSLARGELAGERLEVALATQDQEDEHSCFSDNTHRDVVANARGLRDVWTGRLERPSGATLAGPSLSALVASKDPRLAARISATLDQLVPAAEAIRPPFDQEIRGGDEAPGRQRIQRVIELLRTFSRDVVDAARALGISRLHLVGGKAR